VVLPNLNKVFAQSLRARTIVPLEPWTASLLRAIDESEVSPPSVQHADPIALTLTILVWVAYFAWCAVAIETSERQPQLTTLISLILFPPWTITQRLLSRVDAEE